MPFEEDERDPRTWFIDHNFIEDMVTMFKKVNGVFDTNAKPLFKPVTYAHTLALAKERLIGWYHTGPKLRASDLEINEVIKRFVSR